jgi:hypothetical protein
MTQVKPPSARELAERHLQAEALSVAKSTQSPGQTKEQTKLIAKGIEKGIAFYKQQQKAKAREFDKARKKALKSRPQEPGESGEKEPIDPPLLYERHSFPQKPALLVAGTIFALAALLHGVRVWLGWPVSVGNLEIPMSMSLAAVFLAAALAMWMFRASRD